MSTNVFQELHANLPRPCPGSAECTRIALSHVALPEQPTVLDVGCRLGHQTAVLAQETQGQIFAVDGSAQALSEVTRRAREVGAAARVRTFNVPLLDVPFSGESFDLIWSEAAVFSVGFSKALKAWRPLLKTTGSLVISELSWRTLNPPKDAKDYWTAAYPAMQSVGGNVVLAEQAGYTVNSLFTMPDRDWWTEYYTPLEQRIPAFRARFMGNQEATGLLDIQQWEIDLFRQHSRAYGYVFYVMQPS